MSIYSEDTIADLIKRGDAHAMQSLYSQYIKYLAAICSRYIDNDEDVRDLLHDAFLKIYSSVGSFQYRGPGSLKAWLAKLVVNETLNFIRRNEKAGFIPLNDADIHVEDNDPELENIPLAVIHRMIRELPAGYRTIFNLYVFEEKSHKEIATMLNIKESTSASQFHRAKAMLAKKIKQYSN